MAHEKQEKLDNYMTHNKRPGNQSLPGIQSRYDGKPQKGAKVKNEHDSPAKYNQGEANMNSPADMMGMEEEGMDEGMGM